MKDKITINFSYVGFWTTGALFTLGYAGTDFAVLATYPIWEQFTYLLGIYILWPILLGHTIGINPY